MVSIADHIWKFRLADVEQSSNRYYNETHPIIALEFRNKRSFATTRGFTRIESHHGIISTILKRRPDRRHYYEVIAGETVKPYIDIDIEKTPDNKDTDYDAVVKRFAEQFEDAGVFSSETPTKFSYHVIFMNTKCLVEHVKSVVAEIYFPRVPDELKEYIDDSVYGKNRQLRCILCRKFEGFDNTKKPRQELSSDSLKNQNINAFALGSLITNTLMCENIVKPTIEAPPARTYAQTDEEYEITQSLDFLKGTFKQLDRKGNIVPLKRLKPAWCSVCERKHDNENAYLIVRKSGDVDFRCRRKI